MSWKDLDIKQKAELIKLGVQSGIRDINQIRQLYDDNNTPTQVVDQSYNETNVKPLQGIERIRQEYGIPEEEQNKANEIIQQIENEISLEKINNQQPVQFRQFKNGGYKNKPPFEEWYKTVPADRNDTTYYNLRKAYEELPFEQLERWRTATPEQLNNEQYHLLTVSPQSLEFLKSRNHPSIQYELDWYNSPEGKDFRDKHSLDTTGDYYRYIPKAVGGYINKYNTGGWKEKLLGLGNYAKNYIKAKAGMIQPMFMNLNDYNVQQVTKDNVSNNTLGILTNDFVEENDNNEQRLAIDFKNTTDTKLGDKEIPLENISTYYGIEDGQLKIGPLEIFNDSTMVVPNRAKNVGKVKKVLYKPQEQTEDSQLPLYGITVDNDTVPFPIRMRGKMYLGDEQGNSAFVSGITDPKVFNDVNKFLEQNPSYPAMVDNGRFSHFILGNDLNSYIGIENPDDMYMLGITPKRKGGYISNNPTQALVGKVNKFKEGGYDDEGENKNINNSILGRYVQSKVSKNNQESQEQPTIIIEEPVSESTYAKQPSLSIQEQELLNYLQSNPTAEQEYFRNLAIQSMNIPQSNQGVIQTKEEQNLVDKAFQGYNNFRYSHPWAKGLSYTPIVGDAMDLISLAEDINNKDYMTAGLGLGMLALPNFIEKPIKNYKKLKRHRNNYYAAIKDPNRYIEFKYWNNLADKIALKKYPVLNGLDRQKAEQLSEQYKNRVYNLNKDIQYKTLSLYKNLSKDDYTRLANIINLSPEYGIFLQQNPNLNPLSQETLDKFLERQSLSIRGVSAQTDNDAQVYLSIPPLNATGGDRLNTKGLYTSNSYDIADAFSRPLDNNQTFNSYIGELQFPFIIDKNQTFEQQLKQYRSYIDHYWDLGLTRSSIPGTIAREATYVRGNGDNYKNVIERSYYPKEQGENVVDLVNIHNRGYQPNLRGRWGNENMQANDKYFIPKYPNNSLSEYITFMKAAKKEGIINTPDTNLDKRNKESADIQKLYRQQRGKRNDLYLKALEGYREARDKINKTTGIIGGIAFTTLPVLGLSYAYNAAKSSREAPDPLKMTYEEFIEYDNLVESVSKKTGINKDRLYKYSTKRLEQMLLNENNSRKNGGFLFPNQAFSHKFEK